MYLVLQGTGISCELFLQQGFVNVVGVEPNDKMRASAEEALAKFGTAFQSLKGTAEQTTLADHSVDVVIAAQAYVGFPPFHNHTLLVFTGLTFLRRALNASASLNQMDMLH
jgi:hypothetical protein